jgi:hypothetical protein
MPALKILAAGAAAATLLAACADPSYRTTDASPEAQAVLGDSLESEAIAADPLAAPGAIQDTSGTTIP